MRKDKTPARIGKKSQETRSPEIPHSKLMLLLEKNGLWIITLIIAALALFLFKDFLLLQKFYLFRDIGSDSITINYPGIYHIADYLHTEGFPCWSFKQGLGQNIFPGSLTDPFSDLLILLGKQHIVYAIAWVELLKIIGAGLLFFLFLRKLSLSAVAAAFGAVSYAFSGYIIVGGAWQIFSTEAVLLAFMLFSFEKLFQDDEWKLLPLSIALTASFQPFCMFLHGVFLIVWGGLRVTESGTDIRRAIRVFLKACGLAAIGLLISSFFSIPGILQMMDSPRGSGPTSAFNTLMSTPILSFQDAWLNVTALMRLFSNDLPGTGSQFTGWGNYLEAPLFYCGVLMLLLAPQLFQFLDKKKRIVFAAFLAIFIIPVIFPFFRYALWLFSVPYYRTFGFLVAIAILIVACRALSEIGRRGKIDLPLLGATLTVLLLALYIPWPANSGSPGHIAFTINDSLRLTIAALLVLYAVLLAAVRLPKVRIPALLLLLAAAGAEMIYSSDFAVNTRPVLTADMINERSWYNDATTDATRFLHATDGAFYRTFKDFSSGQAMAASINDAKVQDFYGINSYFSFNQKYYLRFLSGMGLVDLHDEWQTRNLRPPMYSDFRLFSVVSLKYLLTNQGCAPYRNWCDSIARFDNVCILKNKSALPLGYTYEAAISEEEFRKLPAVQKTTALLRAFVGESGALSGFPRLSAADIPANYPLDAYAADLAGLRKDTLAITSFRQNRITGTIAVDKKKLLFFSIPYDKGWQVKVDGKPAEATLVNLGFIGVPLEKGRHAVELSFTPFFFYPGLAISLLGLLLYLAAIVIRRNRRRRSAGLSS